MTYGGSVIASTQNMRCVRLDVVMLMRNFRKHRFRLMGLMYAKDHMLEIKIW